MIKLFACDLDGTLLNKDHQVYEIICEAIEMIEKEHKFFTVASGRHIFENQKLDYDINADYFIISMNGALILDHNSKIISYKCLDKDFISDVLDNFNDYHFDYVSPKYKYIKQSKEEYYDILKNGVFKNKKHFDFENIAKYCIFDSKDEDIMKADIIKLDIILFDDKAKKFSDFISNYDNVITNAPSFENAFEITAKDVNKGMAIRELCHILDVDEDEVAVYGDGGNDIAMLKMFSHSYAPGNAILEARMCASEVIGDHKDHAVALHIMDTLRNRGK